MIDYRVKQLFFDRERVIKATDAATRQNLSKAGAFVRRRARSSIKRTKKKISTPGNPPKAHSGEIKLIFFAYDPIRESVVIGPVGFRNSKVPRLLELGGTVMRKRRTITVQRRGQAEQVELDARPLRYRPRPYMGPALEGEAKNFPDLWRNSVK